MEPSEEQLPSPGDSLSLTGGERSGSCCLELLEQQRKVVDGVNTSLEVHLSRVRLF